MSPIAAAAALLALGVVGATAVAHGSQSAFGPWSEALR
jgi:hypothetical protein